MSTDGIKAETIEKCKCLNNTFFEREYKRAREGLKDQIDGIMAEKCTENLLKQSEDEILKIQKPTTIMQTLTADQQKINESVSERLTDIATELSNIDMVLRKAFDVVCTGKSAIAAQKITVEKSQELLSGE